MIENLLPLFLARVFIVFVFILGIFGQNILGTGESIRFTNATFLGAVISTVIAVPILNGERENIEEKRIEDMLFVCVLRRSFVFRGFRCRFSALCSDQLVSRISFTVGVRS